MKRTGVVLVMALLAVPAAAQMRPVRPVTVPDLVPVVEKACLPVVGGGPVAAGLAAARSMGFTVTATHGELATLQRDTLVLNLAPGSCVLTLDPATAAAFPHADRELSAWLPRLGRFWAGGVEADAAGLNARKFRAGGHTVQVWEAVDEDRQLNVDIGK